MKITSIQVHREDLDLLRPYSISYKTVTSVENLFVQIELENGLQGWGATNPSKYVVGEDLDDTEKTLSPSALEFLIGRDIRNFYQLLDDIHIRFAPHVGARVAVDIALHDAFTQYLDVPLAKFLGMKHTKFATSITIGIKSVDETLEEADEYVGRGFRILKVKLGNDLEEDIERLKRLREKYPNIGIRVDANQGYTLEEVVSFHEITQGMDLELVEQPIKADKIQSISSLPLAIRQTIAADESLVSVSDAWSLTRTDSLCGIFNIKLMKCGGVQPALEIAQLAEYAGIDLMWGCNDESIVSISAALHAALASRKTRYIDLDGSLDLAKDLVSGGFILEEGMMRITGNSGLGIKPI